jgi:DNA replication and repair protein RecF
VTAVATRLELRDFRNYERVELDLGPGLTVVAGPNGAGKTNLLEGLYFGLTGRSCRTSTERELVRQGATATRVSVATVGSDGAGHRLDVGLAPGEPKLLELDGAPVERAPDPSLRPLANVFMPDRLALVKGAPSVRRGHLDQLAAALWPARATARSSYARALAQRNAALARVRSGQSAPATLDPWDAELARHGLELMAVRAEATASLAGRFSDHAAALGLPESTTLAYAPRSRADSAVALRGELTERRDSDLERGFTGHGPHRDDVVLRHGGRSLRAYGSQGQQRVGLLALLFAERDLLLEGGAAPIMLLDDVTSELDLDRRRRLAELVRAGGQAVISTTELAHVPGADDADVTRVAVDGGRLEVDAPRHLAAA